ncbi:U32 family peptidase [Paraferrimonas sp. SM1919]|uniref:U32 family peptidase n=1 Tax=Paraferrimonas sp. SM1919 TaxID=2662263 RepID=UPI0013D6F0FB|nr:U32 family peptidase [Paraferrimonas sp. SM1919]
MKLSLAPLPYCWEKQQAFDYYQSLLESPIERVYLGETVCAKRRLLKEADYLALAKDFSDAGKQVVLSSLSLYSSDSELKALENAANTGYLIETNDYSAIALMHKLQKPFVVGSAVNCYNLANMQKLLQWGAVGFNLPVELPKHWLETLLGQCQQQGIRDQFELELFAHGYLPLAFSARCYTARQHKLNKENCETICRQNPQGMLTQSLDDQPLLRVNGVQTQSAQKHNLFSEVQQLGELNPQWLRLQPNLGLTPAKIDEIHQHLQANTNMPLGANEVNGYWHNEAGISAVC